MDDGLQWVLVDTRYPFFNLWQRVNEEGVLYTSAFSKDENPNIKTFWDEFSTDEKYDYIIRCVEQGETVEEIASRLNIDYRTVISIRNNFIQDTNAKRKKKSEEK